MSRISTDEAVRVAGLVHIALTPEEIERTVGELDVIAASVAKMSEVAIADIPATSHAIPLTNVMCEDIVSPTLDREEILSRVPVSEEGMLLAPQIFGEE